jgi:hypothetical protein
MKLKSIFFACALLAACGGPTAENVATSGRAVSWPLSEVPYFNGPVTVYDSGHWRIIRGCSGFCVSTYKMWIDLAVRNDAFHKVVGIRYTSDGWHSHRDVYAQYEGQLQNGYERWGIELERSTGISMPPDIEYAAFVEMNGRRFWDERNNHYVYKGVTPKRPVRVVESGVTYDATDGAVLSGRVRALPLAADRQVTVRYTTDGWATWKDADAQVAGTTPSDKNDFTFRVSGLGKTTLPEQVTFAVRYRSGGLEYWDNNDKQDYSFQLAPEFRSSSTASLEGPVQGRFTVSGSYSTHLAIERIQYRLDGGHWIDEAKAQIVTDAMNDGSHRLEFRVTLEGGYQQTDNVDFTVRNRIQIVDSWQLTYNGDPVGANWEMDVDSQGRTFTLPFSLPGQSPTPIIRYAQHGDANPDVLFDPLPKSGMRSFAICNNQVYSISPYREKGIHRFGLDGKLDTSFGNQGYVSLQGEFDGKKFCFISRIACSARYLYIADSCNERIMSFDLDGAFLGAAAVPQDNGGGIPGALYVTTNAKGDDVVWVAQRSALRLYFTKGQDPALNFGGTIGLSTQNSSSFKFSNVSGLTQVPNPAGGNYFVATDSYRVVFINSNGMVEASYWGIGSKSARSLANGQIAILSEDELIRLQPTLK